MIVLAAADTLAGVASAASQVTSTIMGMELNGTTETYKLLDQRQLAAAAVTIYTAPGSTEAFIKSIHVVNNDSVARTFQYFRGGTAAANAITPPITLVAGGFAIYSAEKGWTIYDAQGRSLSGSGGSLLRVSNVLQGTTTYTPGVDARALYIEMVGGGGQGGGVANAATNSGAGGGGGAGAFSAMFLSALKASYTVQVGAGGSSTGAGASTGQVGTDSTFDSASVCTAKGGAGGLGDTIALGPRVAALGGAGGLASGGLGDIKADGGAGEAGLALAAAQGVSGRGGDSYFGSGGNSVKTQSAGPAAVLYGGGGAGACALSGGASVQGGAGANGLIRVYEFS